MKNNGVTIITLIITIVVIIILAGITIYYGLMRNTDEAVETKTVYEVHEVLDAITNRSLLNDLNANYYKLVGTKITEMEIDGEKYLGSNGWYLIEKTEEFSELGLSNTTGSYLINYDAGEVLSVKGIVYEDVLYYSLNELKKAMGGGVTVLSKAEYDSNKGVNKPVLSEGMVPVKYSAGNWVVTTSDDEEWYDYSSDQEAWANVMLMDELTVVGYDNATLRNTPLSELAGKEVETEGSAYVWIPRYTATNVGGSGSKIIFSNLTNDVTTDSNGDTYNCPSAFSFGTGDDKLELTGIWVSKYEASFSE